MNPFPKVISEPEQSEQEQLLELLKTHPELMQKYQEELTKRQAGQKKGLHKPMTSREYIQKVKNGTIEQCLDDEGGLLILPDKGLVVKLFDKRTNEKIFVNIVKHEGVDHPEEKLLVDF